MKDKIIDELFAKIQVLEGRLVDQEQRYVKVIKLLEQKIVRLEDELAKYQTPKTSQNSSKPPSQDFVKIRRTQSLRKSSGLKPGAQPGHTGTTLERTQTPDVFVDHKPKACSQCGCDLSNHQTRLSGSYQMVDIPEIQPIWTEHQYFETVCSCGHQNSEQAPSRGAVYGPRIQAYVSYLSVEHYMPYSRISQLLKESFGLRVSEGTIDSMLKKMGQRSTQVHENIRKKVERNGVVGSDETGFRVNGKLHWVWTWQSSEATYLSVSQNRGQQAVEENFPDGFETSLLVHDRLAAQVNTNAQGHQICIAHLLRELRYIQEIAPKNEWAAQLTDLFQETIHLEKELGSDERERQLMKFDAESALEVALSQEAYGVEARRLQRSLTKNRDKLWHYITELEVPSTNNSSERALRNIKVKQKVSTSMRTLRGAQIFCKLRSISETCKKQGKSFFNALLNIGLHPQPG